MVSQASGALSDEASGATEDVHGGGGPSRRVVLVTGGTGLVGSAIRELVESAAAGSRFGKLEDEEWVFTSSSECDLRDPQACRALFERYRPTHVIHLAARVGGLFANMSGNADFLRDNLLLNDAVLQTAHEFELSLIKLDSTDSKYRAKRQELNVAQVKKVVSCLSTCVFPDKASLLRHTVSLQCIEHGYGPGVEVEYPLTEDKVHLGPPHSSNFGYSHAKRLVDVMNRQVQVDGQRAYHQQHGDMFTSVIPTNVFGPHDNFDLRTAHVIPALIHRCFLAKQAGAQFVVGGTGRPLRQFIYSKDLAKLFVWVLRKYSEIDPLILSVDEDEEISIKDVADAIVKAFGFEGPYHFDATKPDGQYRKPASNAKLRRLMGESPRRQDDAFAFTPFETAMQETVEWFLQHYDTDARIGERPSR